MKFSCTQENLKVGLLNIVHIAGKNINLPILSNALIDVSDSLIKLIATDLEIGITASVRGKIEKNGKITVNAKLLTDYVNLLPNGRVDIELMEDELKLACGNFKTKIKSEDAGDYPIIPSVDKANYFSFDWEEFKRIAGGVIFAVAADETRIELSGVYFEFNENELTLAATDSYRLIERKIKYKNKTILPEAKKFIIPTKTLIEITRLSQRSNEVEVAEEKTNKEIKLYVAENQILFMYDEVELVSRIIEGQYPDYKQIIPNVSQENKTTAVLERRELSQAVKASSLFSQTNINDIQIDLSFSAKKITVSSISGQSGESRVEIPTEVSNKDTYVVLNYRYLLDGLNNFEGERVIMEVVDSTTPVVFRIENRSDCLYIIMPIKK